MKPDRRGGPTLDQVERAHLRGRGDTSHVIHRYPVPPEVEGLARRFWIPVWSVPPGREAPQRVLQYPVALVVVTAEYARFYGVEPGVSTTTLRGDGWGVGLLCEPAAGTLLCGGSMADWTGRHDELDRVLGDEGAQLARGVRAAMAGDPTDPDAHAAAMGVVTEVLRRRLPVDEEGVLVNTIVAFVEGRPDVVRVAQVCEEFDVGERALQRLTRRRIGLSPKWLIQRRRLHEAVDRLRAGDAGGTGSLADVAAELGYADQAHFTRDVRRATGMTPGELAATVG